MGWLKCLRSYGWAVCLPLSLIWGLITWLRRQYYPVSKRYRSKLFVIGVGNIHSGGSGKTPVVLEIANHLKDRSVTIVSRGYGGGASRSGGRVDLSDPAGPARFGDEPWMLASLSGVDVRIGRERVRTIKGLEKEPGLPAVILDDGFQHLRLARDVDVVLINERTTVGASFCLPLGELREPLSALVHADAIVLVGDPASSSGQNWRTYLTEKFPSVKIFSAKKMVRGLWDRERKLENPAELTLGGFCGIAFPEGFARDLAALSRGVFLEAFPDHHVYRESDVDRLVAAKRKAQLHGLVTTDKDWYKVAPQFSARKEPLYRLRIGYDLEDDFWYFLHRRLEQRRLFK